MKRVLPTLPNTPVLDAPPPPSEGVVSWNMNTTCNYRCSYCTQRFLADRSRWQRDVPRFVRGFARVAEATGCPWEIKLSGGEPFAHPRLSDVVDGLVQAGLFLSVVTNFSFADDVADFVERASTQLRVFSASLHLEYVDARSVDADFPVPSIPRAEPIERFLQRCVHTQAQLPAGASFVVTTVARPQHLTSLPALQAAFVRAGVVLKVQPEKQGRDVVAYSNEQQQQLVQLGGHNGTGVVAHDFGGQWCWSGARYLIVDDEGEAYRCYPARRYRAERIGNLLQDDFASLVWAAPRPCLYRYCNCTVPIARGMMHTSAQVQVDERDA
jgi:organic radical activating enzyme